MINICIVSSWLVGISSDIWSLFALEVNYKNTVFSHVPKCKPILTVIIVKKTELFEYLKGLACGGVKQKTRV